MRRCEDDKIYLQEMGKGQAGLIWLKTGTGGDGAVVNTVMNLRAPFNSGNFLTN